MACSKDLNQVLVLGFSFMFIGTASKTTTNILKTVLKSIQQEDTSFNVDAYTALSVVYIAYSLGTWMGPPIVGLFGAKRSLIGSAVLYLTWIASFLFPMDWLAYLTSAGNGMAAAVLWTAQGTFISLASELDTVNRNSCIFWGLYQCNFFLGNTLVYFEFQGKTVIDVVTRRVVLLSLCGACILSMLSFMLLKDLRLKETRSTENEEAVIVLDNARKQEDETDEKQLVAFEEPIQAEDFQDSVDSKGDNDLVVQTTNQDAVNQPETNGTDGLEGDSEISQSAKSVPRGKLRDRKTVMRNAINELKIALRLLATSKMALLSVTSLYTGLEVSFYGGVFATSVGFTAAFGKDSKSLIGLMGIFVGVGAVTAGLIFVILGNVTRHKIGPLPVITLGFVAHIVSYVLIYLTLPNAASNGPTMETSYFKKPHVGIVITCGILLGFGDTCFQTQMSAMLASSYSDKPAAAFAIFKFIQAMGASTAFAYSRFTGLHVKLLILACVSSISVVTFAVVHCRWKPVVVDTHYNIELVSSDSEVIDSSHTSKGDEARSEVFSYASV